MSKCLKCGLYEDCCDCELREHKQKVVNEELHKFLTHYKDTVIEMLESLKKGVSYGYTNRPYQNTPSYNSGISDAIELIKKITP